MPASYNGRLLRAPTPGPRVVWDGQSLNVIPYPPHNVPTYCMRQFPGIAWTNIAIGGHGWRELAELGPERVAEQVRPGKTDVIVLNGGQGDIIEGDTYPTDGQTAYERMRDYAGTARSLGFDHVIACTLPMMGPDMWGSPPPPVGPYPTPQGMQNRVDFNDLIMADPDGAFDAIAECHHAPLDDATDTAFFAFDRLHLEAGGAQAMADAIAPVLTPYIT